MALTDLSGRLRRRWDYEADPAAALSFDEMADQLNIRRTELAVLASIANATVQIYLGVTGAVTIDTWMAVGSIPVCLMFLAGASVLQTRTHHRATRALPILFCVFSLILAQAAISIIASDGRLTAGYALVVLAVALVFVFPPRTLVFILGAALASYALVVLQMPVSDWEKAVAFLTAAMCTGVAIAGGALIYMGRQRDHEQKAVIYAQNVRLTARERELKEFMAITAHDLRSPLLGLRNLLRLASRRAQTSPDLPLQVLGAADHSLAAMLGLIDTMLEAHKAEHAPGSPMVIEDLRQPVQAAIERFRPLAESKAVTLAAELGDDPVWVSTDRPALDRILDNLISNAIRFSSDGDIVALRAEQRGETAWLCVRDQGPGIDATDQARVFDKFWRGDAAGLHPSGGSGLGLFIVKALCHRIRAEVRLRSERGKGAAFEIILPKDARRCSDPPH